MTTAEHQLAFLDKELKRETQTYSEQLNSYAAKHDGLEKHIRELNTQLDSARLELVNVKQASVDAKSVHDKVCRAIQTKRAAIIEEIDARRQEHALQQLEHDRQEKARKALIDEFEQNQLKLKAQAEAQFAKQVKRLETEYQAKLSALSVNDDDDDSASLFLSSDDDNDDTHSQLVKMRRKFQEHDEQAVPLNDEHDDNDGQFECIDGETSQERNMVVTEKNEVDQQLSTANGLHAITASDSNKIHFSAMRQVLESEPTPSATVAGNYSATVIPVQPKPLSPGNAQIIPHIDDPELAAEVERILPLPGTRVRKWSVVKKNAAGVPMTDKNGVAIMEEKTETIKTLNITFDDTQTYIIDGTKNTYPNPYTALSKHSSQQAKRRDKLKSKREKLKRALKQADAGSAEEQACVKRLEEVNETLDHIMCKSLVDWEKRIFRIIVQGKQSKKRRVGEMALRQKQEIGNMRPLFEPQCRLRPSNDKRAIKKNKDACNDWNKQLCTTCHSGVYARIEYVLTEKLAVLVSKCDNERKRFERYKSEHEADPTAMTTIRSKKSQMTKNLNKYAKERATLEADLALHRADKTVIDKRFGTGEYNSKPKSKKKGNNDAFKAIGNCIRLHDLCTTCNKLFQWQCTHCSNQLNENFDNIDTATNLQFRTFYYDDVLHDKVDKAVCLRCLIRKACYTENSDPENIHRIRVYQASYPIGIDGNKQKTPPTAKRKHALTTTTTTALIEQTSKKRRCFNT